MMPMPRPPHAPAKLADPASTEAAGPGPASVGGAFQNRPKVQLKAAAPGTTTVYAALLKQGPGMDLVEAFKLLAAPAGDTQHNIQRQEAARAIMTKLRAMAPSVNHTRLRGRLNAAALDDLVQDTLCRLFGRDSAAEKAGTFADAKGVERYLRTALGNGAVDVVRRRGAKLRERTVELSEVPEGALKASQTPELATLEAEGKKAIAEAQALLFGEIVPQAAKSKQGAAAQQILRDTMQWLREVSEQTTTFEAIIAAHAEAHGKSLDQARNTLYVRAGRALESVKAKLEKWPKLPEENRQTLLLVLDQLSLQGREKG
jgi:DNA-directed RNA polymerase specialized sigma24 family protein